MSTRRTLPPSRDRGFALIITITLLAFLVLLLVSLATLTRVETQVAGNNQQLAQARQNALLALNVALGQLQKTAGPDQRVTATAEVLSTTKVSKKKWTGVWDTRATNINDAPVWLVSQADPAVAPTVTTDAPTLLATENSSTTAVRLVGEKSADISTTGPTGSPNNEGNGVIVPVQDIKSDSVPGMPANTTIGRFGYWVSDEGVKARINLEDPYATKTDTLSLLNRTSAAQRTAWELFNSPTDPATVLTETMLTKSGTMLSASQIPLIASGNASATSVLTTVRTSHYHDYSLWSAGVQADVKNGGLKWDLSTGLDMSAALFKTSEFADNAPQMRDPSTNAINSPIESYTAGSGAPAASKVSFVFTPSVNAGGVSSFLRGPSWHLMRGHYQLYQERNPLVSSNTALTARAIYPAGKTVNLGQNTPAALYEVYNALSNNADPGTNRIAAGQLVPRLTQAGMVPYINRVFVRFGIKTAPVSDPTAAAAGRYVVKLVMSPIVVLHNPYNVDLQFKSLSNAVNAADPSSPKIAGMINLFDSTGAGLPLYARIKVNGVDYMQGLPSNSPGAAVLQLAENHLAGTARFRLLVPEMTLKAGEVRVLYPQNLGSASNGSDQPTINDSPTRSASDNTYVTLGAQTNEFGGFVISLLNGVRGSAGLKPFRNPADPVQDVNPGHPATRNDPVVSETNTVFDTKTADSARYATELWVNPSDNIRVILNAGGGSFDIKYAIESAVGDNSYVGGIDGSSLTYQLSAQVPSFDTGSPSNLNFYKAAYSGYTQNKERLNLPANACANKPMYFMAFDMYVKSADHAPDRAARPFVTSNPVAFEQQDSAVGDQGLSGKGTRGFPGIMPSYQLDFVDINPSDGLANFLASSSGQAYWGPSREATAGVNNVALINIPSRPLTSLADFQHANLAIFGYQPYFAAGNSYASPYVPANLDPPVNPVGFAGATSKSYLLYDFSYLLNDALWDKYFFSTLSQEANSSGSWNNTDSALSASIQTWASGTRSLPNSRIVPYNSERATAVTNLTTLKTAYRQAAASSLTLGSFNINSLSVDAWAAVLGSARGAKVVADGSGSPGPTTVTNATAIPRLTPNKKQSDNSTTSDATWNGFTALSDAQIRQFAKNIVAEIKRRQGNKVTPGPFRSLAEFINRSLQNDISAGSSSNAAKGAIQAALDEPTNSLSPNQKFFVGTFQDAKVAQGDPRWAYQWASSGNATTDYLAGQGPTSSTAQGFLLQADVLQQIGPFLSARSDTFVIRTYGESLNPATGESAGKAWCEAIVQRTPEYVDQTDPDLTKTSLSNLAVPLYDATPPYSTGVYGAVTSNLSTTNKTFGRRFKVVSFRWLTPLDI